MSVSFIRNTENIRSDGVFRIYFSGDSVLNGGANLHNFRLPGENNWFFTMGGITFSAEPSSPIHTPVYIMVGNGVSHEIGRLAGDGTNISNFYQPDQEVPLIGGDRIYVSIATDLDAMTYNDSASYNGFISFRREED